MNKKDSLTQANKKIASKMTYADVVQMFNNLNEILGGEYYESRTNMVDTNGEWVPGFVYTGYQAGMGLNRILDKLGIKYSTLILSGSGVEEESEIHIYPESAQRMRDILEKTGGFASNVKREIRHDVTRNKLMEQIR